MPKLSSHTYEMQYHVYTWGHLETQLITFCGLIIDSLLVQVPFDFLDWENDVDSGIKCVLLTLIILEQLSGLQLPVQALASLPYLFPPALLQG